MIGRGKYQSVEANKFFEIKEADWFKMTRAETETHAEVATAQLVFTGEIPGDNDSYVYVAHLSLLLASLYLLVKSLVTMSSYLYVHLSLFIPQFNLKNFILGKDSTSSNSRCLENKQKNCLLTRIQFHLILHYDAKSRMAIS